MNKLAKEKKEQRFIHKQIFLFCAINKLIKCYMHECNSERRREKGANMDMEQVTFIHAFNGFFFFACNLILGERVQQWILRQWMVIL